MASKNPPQSNGNGAHHDAEVDALQREMRATEAVIKAYAAVMAETDGISFYDTKQLPHGKDTIAKGLLMAIKLTPDPERRESLRVALNILARFQDNIGAEPLRPSPQFPDGTPPEEVAALFEKHKPESERFTKMQERACNEEQAYSDMVEKLLGM